MNDPFFKCLQMVLMSIKSWSRQDMINNLQGGSLLSPSEVRTGAIKQLELSLEEKRPRVVSIDHFQHMLLTITTRPLETIMSNITSISHYCVKITMAIFCLRTRHHTTHRMFANARHSVLFLVLEMTFCEFATSPRLT